MATFDLKQFGSAEFAQNVNNVLPPIVSFILVIILAKTLADLTWSVVPQGEAVPAPPRQAAAVAAQVSRSNNSSIYAQIPNWHLFGVPQAEIPKPVEVVQEVPEEAPDTTLRLTLKGVMASRDMMDAWAIIADQMGTDDNYHIGSELPGGATLEEIYADRVILRHNGRLETLRLPETDMTGTISRAEPAPSSRRSSRSQASVRRNDNRNVTQLTQQATEVVKSYRDKLINDPQSVMNTVRAEPYRQAGQLKGYRIFPGRDQQLFGQVGLQPGDVVTAVNGIELDSPLKGLEIMQNITDATEVSVDVLRNGVNQTFMVPLN